MHYTLVIYIQKRGTECSTSSSRGSGKPCKRDIDITAHAISANHCYSILFCFEIYQISRCKIEAQRFVFNPQCLNFIRSSVAKIRNIFVTPKLFHKKIHFPALNAIQRNLCSATFKTTLHEVFKSDATDVILQHSLIVNVLRVAKWWQNGKIDLNFSQFHAF